MFDRESILARMRGGPALAQCLGGRDNNLNLIRIVAAGSVLVSHAFALVGGDDMAEPLRAATGLSLGQYAVAIFFGISGLLISRSFDRRQSIVHFGVARFLRLWPALLVVLTLTAFVLGPALTQLSVRSYFHSRETWTYVPLNASLAFRYDFLSGVFERNPYGAATNGSLWSLFYEVMCYCGVVAVGYLGGLRRRRLFALFLAGVVAGHVWSVFASPPGGIAYRLDVLGFVGFPFALGMACYVWRDALRLSLAGLGSCWLLVAFASSTPFFSSMIMAALVYSALWCAFVPKGALLRYNALGDFSYGVYIYAFPVQQTLIAHQPGQSPWTNMAYAIPVTLVLSMASWHLIEKRALAFARPAGDRLSALLLSGSAPAKTA